MYGGKGDRMIVVEGTIRGKQRPRFNTKTGRAFTSNQTINYENWIKQCYIEQSNKLLQGAIRARIEIYYSVPKSYSKRKIEAIKYGTDYPMKKPDCDNVVKIVLDSLNKIAYDDDKQVAELTVLKRWTFDNERIEFGMEEIK